MKKKKNQNEKKEKKEYIKNHRSYKKRITSRTKKRTKKVFNSFNESKQTEFKSVIQKLIMRYLIFRYICEDINFLFSLLIFIFTLFNQYIPLLKVDRNLSFIIRIFVSLKLDFEFYIFSNYSLRQMIDY